MRQSLAADAAACKEQGNLLFPKLSRDEREPLDRGNGFETTVAYAEDWMMDNNLDAYVSRCLRDRGWEQK